MRIPPRHTPAQGYGPGQMGGPMGQRGPGEIVTGEDAQKAIDAALAVVPGTADHVHKDASGNYLVMVTTSDNTHTLVVLDANFAFVEQKEMPAGGPGGPGHGPGTPATDEQTQKATDAVLAEYPAATVLHVFVRDGEGYAVLMRTDNGKKKVVLLDEQYTIQSVENPRKRGPHGKRGHGPLGHDVTGPNFKKAEAAALEEFPGGTVMDVHKKGKKFYAMVKKADDSMVVVVMNADFEITGTKAMDFPMRHQQPTATSTAA
ncbi:MAG: hypothetical protein V9E98_04770 [Candidatus Nanopelagicales bacterium]